MALTVLFSGSLLAQESTAERATAAFFRNQMDSAVTLFAIASRENPRDARVQAWLAEAGLRAGKPSDAAAAVDKALEIDRCNAQAHLVRASLFMPRFAPQGQASDDSTWTHLMRSVECDPNDGNTWTDVWKYAIMRRDTVMEARALHALAKTGFLTRPQMTHAEWLLTSLPPRAVLLTGGDLDTFAPLAVQLVRGVRRDVAVLNVVMLSATWYSRPMLARHELHYESRTSSDSALRGAQRIIALLRRQGIHEAGRPLAFALTAPVDTSSRDGVLQLAGPYWLLVPPGSAKTDSSRISEALHRADAAVWQGNAISTKDRSPIRRMHQPHPALLVARVALLESALRAQPLEQSRSRHRWTASFLKRAGVDSVSADRLLRQFRTTHEDDDGTDSPLPSASEGQLPERSSRFFRQFEVPFSDDELFYAFAVTDEASRAREKVRELRQNNALARDYYRAIAANEKLPDQAVVAALSHDLLAVLANLSDSTAAKVREYMYSLWPPSDDDNSESYRLFEIRRRQLAVLVRERLKQLGSKPDS